VTQVSQGAGVVGCLNCETVLEGGGASEACDREGGATVVAVWKLRLSLNFRLFQSVPRVGSFLAEK